MHRRALPLFALAPLAAAAGEVVTIFAAASLTDALRVLGQEWAARGNPAPRFSFAASSALARQIEQGAPADLFMAADEAWMDYLQQRNLIVNASRSSPLGNALVLVVPANAARPVALARGTDLAALLGPQGRIATGDPAHVPVGRYAQAALEWMGQWPALAPRLARAENVRAALLLVDAGWSEPPAEGVERWLAGRHLGGTRAEHLASTPIAIAGATPPAMRPWLARLRAAGAVPSEGLPAPSQPDCWAWLAAARATPGPGLRVARDYVAWEPGALGPLRIDELSTWGEPGRIGWRPGPPPALTTRGVARLDVPDAQPGLTVDGRRFAAPRGRPALPAKVVGQACGPLAAYADGPFTLVIGTTEHDAAATANGDLAQAFAAAWIAHAHGTPRHVLDRDFRAEQHLGRHLVLVGNPRSNGVLRALVADGLRLPVTWDERNLRIGEQSWPRAERRALALAWPHPAHDGRLLVVLDGAPAWGLRGLPLAGLPDLALGPGPDSTRPTLRRLFACDWR